MATLKLEKKTAFPFFILHECGDGVRRVAEKVSRDVIGVTDTQTEVSVVEICAKGKKDTQHHSQAVFVATDGCGERAEKLLYEIPELKRVKGKKESYAFLIRENVLEEAENALVIYGSDRLGTIYGLFHLSELLGVTPMLYWGDCPYKKRNLVIIDDKDNYISKEPSVAYRGFFINDEWPCFGTWTTSHFGGFNAEMYDHIFEYLLRMKGNYLWPAMWSSCFMLDGPGMESMKLADEYGIYIGMSHHEPCMRSGAEYSKVRGKGSPYGDAWSYKTNKEGIIKFWEDGLKRSQGYRVFPTIGMRGENDSKILGYNATISENVRLLKEVITKQRELIRSILEKKEKKVPQLFAVYKEVEDYYFGEEGEGLRGFKELEDVTLLLCDDNFGNMRTLPEQFEKNHPGGFGMYYHLDYHGDPISYEWVASTPLMKIWEQMTEAYEYGIRQLWIVNVGDVKFQEIPLNYFMSLAYDFETWGSKIMNSAQIYTKMWIDKVFGSYTSQKERKTIREVLEGYLRLNALRRPEALNDQIYHPAHESESEGLLRLCDCLENKNEEVYRRLADKKMEDAYYSMIYFPAAASLNLLKMHLYSGKNHLYASQGKAVANVYGKMAEDCIEKDQILANEMGNFNQGKWNGMQLASHIGFTNWNDEDWRYPVRHTIRLPEKARLIVSRADEIRTYTNQYFPKPLVIKDFAESECNCVKIQIANGGQEVLKWRISESARIVGMDGVARETERKSCDWISFSQRSGATKYQEELILTVDKEKLLVGQEEEYQFEICTDTEFVPVIVTASKKERLDVPDGTFVAENGMFVLDAVHFTEAKGGIFQGETAEFKELKQFGKYDSGIKVFPVTASFLSEHHAPAVIYQICSEMSGTYCLELHTSPANPLVYGGERRMGVSVNGKQEEEIGFTGKDYKSGEVSCSSWKEAVLNQEHVGRGKVMLEKGVNKIQISAREAGIVLQRLVLYPIDTVKKESYLGPKESMRINRKDVTEYEESNENSGDDKSSKSCDRKQGYSDSGR